MKGARILVASRPLAWLIAPVIWFSGLIHSGSYSITVKGTLFALALSLPTCLVTFGVNDAYDYDSDQHNARKKKMWTDGIPLPKENHEDILRACKCSYLIIFLMTYPAWITSMRLFLYVLSFSVLIWVYSAPLLWGKSEFRRLKEQPLLDSLSNGLICWLFWACGYIFTGDTPPNAELWSSFGWLIFFFASALHSLAAMVDVRGDLYAGHRTIAVGYGERLAATFSAICFFFAKLTVELRSDVGLAISAGIITSVILIVAPQTKHVMVRLVFAGAYIGSIVWVIKKMVGFGRGQDVTRSW